MKHLIRHLYLVATATLIGYSMDGLAQSETDSTPPQVVVSNVQGNRAYLEIKANNLQSAINELYNLSTAASNSGWSTILENGSNPGMDVNYNGYDILGVGSFGADGTLSADSLILMKDGVIQGSLTLQSGLHVDSIFAINEDVVLDLDGSGLLKVDGKGLFTDSLKVNGHAVIEGTLFADSLAVTDVINGRVSSLSNHSTDALSEGSTNLYYTDTRARGAISGGTGVTFTAATGSIAIGQAVGTTDNVSFAGVSASATVTADSLSVTDVINGQVDDISNHNSDDLDEGSSNLYYTDARARGSLSGGTGVTYTSSTGAIAIGQAVGTTDNVSFAGVSASATVTADSLSVTDVINGQVDDISNHDTDELTEGTSNLYFTDARAISALEDTITYLIGEIDALKPVAESSACGPVTYNGYTYETVQIGAQCWFAENLQTTVYADGSEIPLEGTGPGWSTLGTGARCPLDDDASNVSALGYIYNGYAVLNASGLCPSGWKVPSEEDWQLLLSEVGEDASLLKSPTDWDGLAEGNSGFSAIPAGARSGSTGWNPGQYYDQNKANFWSSTTSGSSLGYYHIQPDNNVVSSNAAGQAFGWSVRCVLDEALVADVTPPTMTIEAAEVMDGGTSPDASLSMTFTASESTADFDAADITVLNGSISAFTGSGTTYTATFTPDGPGYCAIEVAAGAFSDESQNASIAADQFFWISLDLTPPTISITASEVSDGDSSGDASLTLTFTSSEATTDFTAEDLTVTNGVISSFTGAGTTYSATFTPDADGDCAISVAAGSFNDAAGNGNVASDEFNWTYSIGPPPCAIPSVTYDGHTYGTVQIGSQCWLNENLITTTYSNGSAIPNNWSTNNTSAAYSTSDVGNLYNYYVVTNSAGICPSGWSVANEADWTTLLNHYGGASTAGASLKSSVDWNGSLTIDYFNAVPTPFKGNNGWEPGSPFNETYFWVANTGNDGTLEANYKKFTSSDAVTTETWGYNTGLMIRCIQD